MRARIYLTRRRCLRASELSEHYVESWNAEPDLVCIGRRVEEAGQVTGSRARADLTLARTGQRAFAHFACTLICLLNVHHPRLLTRCKALRMRNAISLYHAFQYSPPKLLNTRSVNHIPELAHQWINHSRITRRPRCSCKDSQRGDLITFAEIDATFPLCRNSKLTHVLQDSLGAHFRADCSYRRNKILRSRLILGMNCAGTPS